VPDIVPDLVFVLARTLIAGAVAWSAVRYGFGGVGMTWAESYRSPFPKLLRRVCVLVVVVAALAMIAGAWADIAALVLVALLLWVTLAMHPFWREHDPNARTGQKVHLIKNLGLVGGALAVFYVYNQLGDATAISLTDPILVEEPER
jgi:putative oxidoreductase